MREANHTKREAITLAREQLHLVAAAMLARRLRLKKGHAREPLEVLVELLDGSLKITLVGVLERLVGTPAVTALVATFGAAHPSPRFEDGEPLALLAAGEQLHLRP